MSKMYSLPIKEYGSVPTDETNVDSDAEVRSSGLSISSEIRNLYACSKVDILSRLVQSRTAEARLKHQLNVYEAALSKASGEKMKLQLDIAYCNKNVETLEQVTQEMTHMYTSVSQQNSSAVEMMGELDTKRMQLIKALSISKDDCAEYKQRLTSEQNERNELQARLEFESSHHNQQQSLIDKLNDSNENLRNALSIEESKHQSLISSYSTRLDEMEGITAKKSHELTEASRQIEVEAKNNATLKEHMDTILNEKTQLSIQLVSLECKMAEMENDIQTKLEACEMKWQTILDESNQQSTGKLNEMAKVTEKLAAERALLEEIVATKENDLLALRKTYEEDMTKSVQLEKELSKKQENLDDYSNKIVLLQTELAEQAKCHQEQKNQLISKNRYTEQRVEDLLKVLEIKQNRLCLSEEQANTLKEETNLQQFFDVNSQSESPGVALNTKTKEQEFLKTVNTENATSAINTSAQITSTPIYISGTDSSAGNTPKKLRRVSVNQKNGDESDSSYNDFRSNVNRRRISVFKPPTNEIPITVPGIKNVDKSENSASALPCTSSASTFNMNDAGGNSSSVTSTGPPSASVRAVKPFFRKHDD